MTEYSGVLVSLAEPANPSSASSSEDVADSSSESDVTDDSSENDSEDDASDSSSSSSSDSESDSEDEMNLADESEPPAADIPIPVTNSRLQSIGYFRKTPLFDASSKWYALPALHLDEHPYLETLAKSVIDERLAMAEKFYERELASFTSNPHLSSGDRRFANMVMHKGTSGDRISALALAIQSSPAHNLEKLAQLMGMVTRGNRDAGLVALTSLTDLFVTDMLPERKLAYFADQPHGHPDVTPQHLVAWYFEDNLKRSFYSFVRILETGAFDTVTHIRRAAMESVFSLLTQRPEQEQNLLRILCNKMGDSDPSIRNKVNHLLMQLMATFPNMSIAVVNALAEVVNKSSTHDTAYYYSVATLNQVVLYDDDPVTSNRLMEIYIQLFRQVLLANDEPPKSTLPTKPVHKPFRWNPKNPHGPAEPGKPRDKKRWRNLPDEGATRRAQRDQRNTRIQAVKAKVDAKESLERAELHYTKLITAILTGINRCMNFAQLDNVVYTEYLELLFKILSFSNFNTVVQALMLILKLAVSQPDIWDHYYMALYESLLDQRLLSSSKQAMYINILYRSLLLDNSPRRLSAFVKRIVQTAMFHDAPFVCGVFFMLTELFQVKPHLRSLIIQAEEVDESEKFVDAPEPADGSAAASAETKTPGTGGAPTSSANAAGSNVPKPKKQRKGRSEEITPKIPRVPLQQPSNRTTEGTLRTYNQFHSNPFFSFADSTCLWEILPFVDHFHPAVAYYAVKIVRQLLQNIAAPNLYSYSLQNFLDKFVFRNPKKNQAPERGMSLMQPRVQAADPTHGEGRHILSSKRFYAGLDQAKIGSGAEAVRKSLDAPADDRFIYAYLREKKVTVTTVEGQKTRFMDSEDWADEDHDDDDGDDEAAGGGSGMDEAWPEEDAAEEAEALALMQQELGGEANGGLLDVDAEFEVDFEAAQPGDFNQSGDDSGSDGDNGDEDEDEGDDDRMAMLLQDDELAAPLEVPSDGEAGAGSDDDDDDDEFGAEKDSGDEEAAPSGNYLDAILKKAGIKTKRDIKRKTKEGGANGDEDKKSKKPRKSKLSDLPLLASFDDYAKLIE
ncbi:RNA-binding ribosome biosynthesis protein mak21 [Dimargaris cristalligena]|nr:RNA-binding ribosome biosynthesis protein mak21 [Dimargaris cristalligena]